MITRSKLEKILSLIDRLNVVVVAHHRQSSSPSAAMKVIDKINALSPGESFFSFEFFNFYFFLFGSTFYMFTFFAFIFGAFQGTVQYNLQGRPPYVADVCPCSIDTGSAFQNHRRPA